MAYVALAGLTTAALTVLVGLGVVYQAGPGVLLRSETEVQEACSRVSVGMTRDRVAAVLGTDGRPHPTREVFDPYPGICIKPGPTPESARSARELSERLRREARARAGYYREYRLPGWVVEVHFAGDPDAPRAAAVEVTPARQPKWRPLAPWLVAAGVVGLFAADRTAGARRPRPARCGPGRPTAADHDDQHGPAPVTAAPAP
jgi:hypothetical protein